MTRRSPYLFIALIATVFALQPIGLSADEKPAAPVPAQPPVEQAEQPQYLTDSPTYRKQAVLVMLCDLFAIKDEPGEGDEPIDLLPKGTEALPVINPGFEFTHSDGQLPGRDWWFVGFREADEHRIYGGGQGRQTDPIQGWNGDSCAGLESGRPMQWVTAPDGCTGYIVAHQTHTLHQTLQGALKPNTRYTLLVEVFKRKDYKRCEAEDLIIKLEADEDNTIDADTADYAIHAADPETHFAVNAITFTTTADQTPGDLIIRLGMNTTGPIRVNFDNVRLWAQPLD